MKRLEGSMRRGPAIALAIVGAALASGAAASADDVPRPPGAVEHRGSELVSLPDLMVALRGQVAIDLTGKVSIPGATRLATDFDTIPDVPITRFSLKLVSGRSGPVGIVSNLCTARARAATAGVTMRAQSGKVTVRSQRLHVAGCARPSPTRGRAVSRR
jgi:hypothetical protein